MEIRQLECFVAVAEELHFGRAAKRMHIAQPPLSRHIQNLEGLLGVRLFERTNRQVDLTAIGQVLLEEVKPALRRLRSLPETARRLSSGAGRVLNIGAVGPALDGPLPEVLRRFRNAHQDVIVNLQAMGTVRQIERLRNRELDIAFIRPYRNDLSGFNAITVHRDRYCLALPKGHRLCSRKRVALGDLDGEELVFFPRESHPQLFDDFLGALNQAGARVKISQEADNKNAMLSMVAADLGVAIVPSDSAAVHARGIEVVALHKGLPDIEICALWNEGHDNPAIPSLIDSIRELRAHTG